MNEQKWSSGNSYLRLLNSLHQESSKVMTLCLRSEQELQLVLEAIQKFGKCLSTGKANQECRIQISLHDVDSKEMST